MADAAAAQDHHHNLAGVGGVRRKPTTTNQAWLVISDSEGIPHSHIEDSCKHSIIRRTGLPARDLRILDPLFSYPSTILGRERAIVINLGHVKAVITATEALVPNPHDPTVAPLLRHLPKHPTDERLEQVAYQPPFEFRVLEACLESACRCLESETLTLEEEARPVLDSLHSNMTTHNLERVRHTKSRLVVLSGRVQRVRGEIQHLLDDDRDMAEMYLTRKLQPLVIDTYEQQEPDVQELEMLLEAYLVQIDGTLSRLSALEEYVDDTEDYVNTILDEKQNQLLQTGVMLGMAMVALNVGIVIVSVLGMNIHETVFDKIQDRSLFWKVTLGSLGGCLMLYFVAIGWGKRTGVLWL